MSKSVPVSRSRLQRLLVLGLGLSALLLLLALLIAIRAVHQIDSDTQTFADRQSLGKGAIDEIERQQNDLNTRWLQLAERKDVVRREEILDELAQTRAQMSSALESAYEQAEFLRESIYQEGHGLLRWTIWLFAICVGLSILCASWTVRASADVFRRLEQQASELAGMQYQFLETQEHTLRRFSHELHDELGQALTAVKANLSAMRRDFDAARVNDTMQLVDRAIQDVREMSQLLRPTILDDFGLDAAMRALSESFAQRTGIKVDYQSNMDDRRLSDQAETNLYRIGQEALTNIARHSGATSAEINLKLRDNGLMLTIRDNGHGFDAAQQRGSHGLGLAGMETRARGCGGTLILHTAPGKGLSIEVFCPVSNEARNIPAQSILAQASNSE